MTQLPEKCIGYDYPDDFVSKFNQLIDYLKEREDVERSHVMTCPPLPNEESGNN